MKAVLIIFFFSCNLMVLLGGEQWTPSEHPAKLSRTISGFTEPCAFLDLEAEKPGRLKKIYFKEGDALVGDGQDILLAEQDSKLNLIALEASKAALATEIAVLKKYVSEKNIQLREINYRKLEMDRIKTLAKEGKVARSNYDLVVFEHDRALLKLKDIDVATKIQETVIAEKQITLNKAKEDIKRFQSFAPKGWILNERYVEPGSWIGIGEKICQVVDVRQLSVFFRLNTEELVSLRRKLDIKLKGTVQNIKAVIHRVDLNFDPITRKRLVELRIPAKELPEAAGGMELSLTVNVPYPSPAVLVPLEYTFRKLEQDYIKLSNGKELSITPLKRMKEALIIDQSSLPQNCILTKPPNK